MQDDRSFEGANALGWFARTAASRTKRPPGSRPHCLERHGPAWRPPPASATARVKAIEGYATALANLGRDDEALQSRTPGAAPLPPCGVVRIARRERGRRRGAGRRRRARSGSPISSTSSNADRSTTGAAALGWLHYRSENFAGAVDWFAKAVAWSPNGKGDLKTNQGLALALQRSGRLAEAEEVAWAWRQRSAELRATYIAIVVAELARGAGIARVGQARIDRFVELVRADRSPLGAQAIGWHRLRQGNCSYAAPWFRAAAAWSADRSGDLKIAEGLALVAQRGRPVSRGRGRRLRLARPVEPVARALSQHRRRGADA